MSLLDLNDSPVVLSLLVFLMKPVDHRGFFLPVAWSVKVCNLYIKECSLLVRPETSGTQWEGQRECGGAQTVNL